MSQKYQRTERNLRGQVIQNRGDVLRSNMRRKANHFARSGKRKEGAKR